MHLFEALIELAMVDPSPAVLARCAALDHLARTRLIESPGAILHEQFDAQWQPVGDAVEPGHQMEWAWLLGRYAALTGEDRTELIDALVARAMATGIDPATGRAVDLCDPAGTVLRATSRSWPHAEAAKALADQIRRGRIDYLPAYRRIVERLLDRYCPPRLQGGWLDQLDAEDRPLSAFMPASSLYHVYFGLKSLYTLEA
jgi:mannose-6-phosphate isomerase